MWKWATGSDRVCIDGRGMAAMPAERVESERETASHSGIQKSNTRNLLGELIVSGVASHLPRPRNAMPPCGLSTRIAI